MNPSCSKQSLRGSRDGAWAAFKSPRSAFRALVVCGVLTLGGCKAFQINTQTNTLSESGFLARMPRTPKQSEAYAALPSHVLLRGRAGGGAFYVYKDERTGAVYIGSEENYQRYMVRVRRLAAYFETTEAKMAARDMDASLERLWYSSWADLIRLDTPKQNPSPTPSAEPSPPPRRFDFADPW